MISLTFIIIFIFCLAFAIASILVSHQFINTYNTDFHKNYFYYLVSFYAFSIYSIWGQVLVRALLSSFDSGVHVIETVANFLPVLGVPFLFVSWIMLIKMAYSMFDKKVSQVWIFVHPVLFIIMLAGSWGIYILFKNRPPMIQTFLTYMEAGLIFIFEFIYFLSFYVIAIRGKRKVNLPGRPYLMTFSLMLVVVFLLRTSLLSIGFLNIWVLAGAILIFFGSNFIPLFYLRIYSDHIFSPVKAEHTNEDLLKFIFKKYGITKREREIVIQICQGKTNQQIADELFISLQTVKDHTHRIYSKMDINSRMQLVQKVNG